MVLDYHLERKLRFKTNSEHNSLYSWSVVELDELREQVGEDQIPWAWTLYFTATEIVLHDDLEIQEEEVAERRSIHAALDLKIFLGHDSPAIAPRYWRLSSGRYRLSRRRDLTALLQESCMDHSRRRQRGFWRRLTLSDGAGRRRPRRCASPKSGGV